MPRPPTIGEVIASGDEVSATCGARRCRRRVTLDLVALSDRHGAGVLLIDLAERLLCTCGHRGAELTRSPVKAPGFARRHA